MGKPKTDRQFWESTKTNANTYQRYYNRFVELAINAFEWRGLPETVDPRFLELILFTDGRALFFRDDVLGGIYALQCMGQGQIDVYRNPMQRNAYATNGYNVSYDNTNSVIVYNNYLRTNTMLEAELYAQAIYKIERIIDVNVNAQRTPVIVVCDESQRIAMQNLLKAFEGNEPFLYGYKNIDLNAIKVLNTQAPFVADKLQILKRQIWNEAMTYLGVDNSNTEKKERLVTDEITSNLDIVAAHREIRLNARRDAAKQINTMFGTNISVHFRREEQKAAEPQEGESDE